MKLLVVTQYFWPESFGINRQVRDLIAQGVDVTVLTGKPNYPSGKLYHGYTIWGSRAEQFESCNVFRVPVVPRGSASSFRLTLNYLSFILSGLCIAPWLLRKQRYDAILVYAPSPIFQAVPAVLLAKIKRVPLLIWIQDLWPQSLAATGHLRNRFALSVLDYAVRWLYRRADLLLVQSQAFVSVIRRQAGPGATIRYFPNSAEPLPASSKMTPCSKAEPLVAHLKSKFAVVFTGNVGAAQSLQTIIHAASLCKGVPNICFFVVGVGSKSDWLAQEIERQALTNVCATGWLPPECMPAVWEAASVLLVTLSNEPIFHMTIPNKLQCYFAAGKPVIGCLAGEGAKVIEDAKAGLTCPPEDGIALANAVQQLAAMSAAERRQLGENGQRFFEQNFHPVPLTNRLIDMLAQVINASQPTKT